MLGIDRRLIVASTGRWLRLGIAFGIAGLVASLAFYWLVGLVVEGMLYGRNRLAELLPWVIALLVAKLVLGWAYRAAQYRASALTKLTVRDRIYSHALAIGPAVLDRRRTGELVNVAVEGMEWLELFYGVYFVQFVVGMATPVLLCVFVGAVDWVVGLALVASIPLTPLFLGLMARNFRGASSRYAAVNDRLSAQFLDSLQGMTTLRAFNLGGRRGREMRAAGEALRRETMRLLAVNQMMILFVDFGFALGTTTVLTVTALLRMNEGALGPGEVVALVLASAEFARPLTLVGQFFFAGAVGRELAKRIVAFLSETPAVADPVAPTASSGSPPRALLPRPALQLRDVSFRYPGAARDALAGITLELRPGETVALVGASGSGKTTLAGLILRTLAPQSGSIELDGRPVAELPLGWVRAHVALVPQDPCLFHGTIAANLRVAKEEASDAELRAACRAANVLEFIESLPEGFETRIGERGSTLSGGQAQRIAIARAVLKNAPIIVLDEPTSHVDLETEAAIHEALERLMRERTVLLIAHRLSTVRRADRIVVLAEGRVLECGTHAELAARGGAYARMLGVAAVSSEPMLAGGGRS